MVALSAVHLLIIETYLVSGHHDTIVIFFLSLSNFEFGEGRDSKSSSLGKLKYRHYHHSNLM